MPGLTRHPGMNSKNYYVYVLANKRNGTLYIGVTSNLKNVFGNTKIM